ncbi:hypothetical protein RND81_03G007800 [Saponaria officinalis]|uniref:Protein FAR1-RELATED SEQUENCE n=1 Tax=Saponaria officinalis TaxID=3572 RepID=A0AAW1M4D0_SAPOF
MTSNVIPSTPLTQPAIVEKHTPPILLSYSPKGSQQWIRKVEEEFMPRVGMDFNTLEDGIQFYRIYAIACGFDIRKSSQISKKMKKLVNTEADETSKGKTDNNKGKSDNKKERVTTIRRFGCTAMIKLMFQSGKYVIFQFCEGHNHPLVLVKNREFQKLSRNLTLYHKQTIINHSKINIGASKTYRICKEVANGYENVGASLLDFKNFQREVKLFIGDADAEMFINNLEKLVHSKKGFQYAYHVDEGRNLSRVFWTDAHGKSAYLAFGDGVSFDPTYGTNKYCMVFTPFTGIDNHKKSVTFACALLSNEDEESFVWVFEKFMDAMGRKEPQIIITDQDPAIRNAVPTVFKTARYRFCLWHIMNKVADKIDIITRKETDFLSRLNGFEIKWNEVITKFGLDDNRWLSTMFDIKEYWIPAYFRDMSMGNIMSTTQRLESENSFFKKFENHYGTLLFEIRGLICRHIFWVFSNKLLKTIPEKYILTRWSKHALRGPIYDLNGNIIENYDAADESQLEMSKVWSEFYNVISVVAKKEADVLRDLQRVLREFKDTVEPTKEKMSKRQEMEMLIGCSTPDEVRILPPRHSKNKGSKEAKKKVRKLQTNGVS